MILPKFLDNRFIWLMLVAVTHTTVSSMNISDTDPGHGPTDFSSSFGTQSDREGVTHE